MRGRARTKVTDSSASDKLKTKALGDNDFKKEIALPAHTKNVAKVQIWCAFVEMNLGEASFSSPVM
jgi:hypothetical protein